MTFGSGYTKGSGFLSAFLYDVHKELKQSRTLLKNFATLAGREWAFAQLYSNTAAGTQGANYIASSQTASSLNDALTTLPGEITTGGLGRAQGTVTHIANTNVAIIYKDFTATADFTSPGITAAALFNATYASGGTMAHVGTIDPILPVDNGETVRLTGTVNISIPV